MTSTNRLKARLQKAGLRRSKAEEERRAATIELAAAILAASKAGMRPSDIAREANVSRQTVHNVRGAK